MAVLVSDSFNRADSTTTLGTTDSYAGGTAKTWNYVRSTWGITGNKAYMPANSGGAGSALFYAWVEAGASDVSVTTTVTDMNDTYALSFRIDPTADSYILYHGKTGAVQTTIANAYTTIATLQPLVSGDTIKVTAQGNTLTFYRNGTNIGAVTTTFNQTATKHGLSNWRNTATTTNGTWDNFIIEDLASGTTYTGSGTAQGSSNVSASPAVINAANGSVAGISSVSGTPIMIFVANGVAQGISSVVANEIVKMAAMGAEQGGSLVSVSEHVIFSAYGAATGLSSINATATLILKALGVVDGYSSVIVQGPEIIGRIKLIGTRELHVALIGLRELHVPLAGSRELHVNLRGDISVITVKDLDMVAGESKYYDFDATDSGSPIPLAGATIKMIVKQKVSDDIPNVYKVTPTDITITNAAAGKFTVKFVQADTSNLSGVYNYAVWVTDASGNENPILTGVMTIKSVVVKKS